MQYKRRYKTKIFDRIKKHKEITLDHGQKNNKKERKIDRKAKKIIERENQRQRKIERERKSCKKRGTRKR